jgi:hypothetical protein
VISWSDSTISILSTASFISMCIALIIGCVIILGAMWRAKRAETRKALEYAVEGK